MVIKKYFFNKTNKLIILFTLFIFINGFFIILKSYVTHSILLEIYKSIQIIFLNLVFIYLIKNKVLSYIVIGMISFFYFVLNFFYFFTSAYLDFFYIKRSWGQIHFIIYDYKYFIILMLIISILYTLTIYQIKPKIKFKYSYLFIILLIITGFYYQPKQYDNELFYFFKTIQIKDKVIEYYEIKYNNLVENSINSKVDINNEPDRPVYLENIIIFHLESINDFLVNEQITPNLLTIAKQGILFDNFYSNSIQTMGAYENILCSLPTSFKDNLVNTGLDKEVLCLPKILKQYGYTNYIFKGGARLENTKTTDFVKNIGFDEAHNDDIMDDDDHKYNWGYREDAFFNKTFNYLANNKKDKYNFIYIDVGTTNHYQFNTPAEYLDIVPYKNYTNFSEKISNTMFLQDQFLKIGWARLNELFPNKNYTLIILSDNGWPAAIQNDNSFNEKGSLEENFRIPMVMIIGDESEYQNKIITTRYSHLDILPSLADLLEIKINNSQFAESFMPSIENNITSKRNLILIQPYSDKYINLIIENHLKYQYNSLTKKITLCDLDLDPLENNPQIITHNEQESLDLIKQLMP